MHPPGLVSPSSMHPPGPVTPSSTHPPGLVSPSSMHPPGLVSPSFMHPPGPVTPSSTHPPGPVTPSSTDPPSHVRGNQFVKAQRWSEAIACYSRAIRCYANDPIFYANRALCFLKTQDYRSAETDCTASLQLDESYVKAYQRRAAARVALGQLTEARADLEKVLEREPNNSASRSELYKVLKKLETQGKTPARTNSSLSKKSSKVVDPAATVAKPSNVLLDKRSKCSTNQGLVERQDKGLPTCESKVKLVETVHKPPHLRSKKPLKRIAIMDHDGAGESTSLATKDTQGSLTLDTSPSTGGSERPSKDETSHLVKTETLNNVVERTGSISISCQEPLDTREESPGSEPPPVPTSYLGFVSGWSKVQSCPRLRYLYLKQIRGLDLPKIFQDSLESGVLTDILSTLASEFTSNDSAVYGHLLGLSRVRRFGSSVLFMSPQDKTNVSKLLSYCEGRKDCTEHEAAILKKLYEL
uniref:RNA polymerase II-associated protein 3 n=1 Tax=Timema monikensis TaxID=170555 RepID=A0A7R9E5H2_9NEOP|nr:unnamed protein product [Timema monikensis]